MSETPNEHTPEDETTAAAVEAEDTAAEASVDDAADDVVEDDADEAFDEEPAEREPLPLPDELHVGLIADGVVAKLVDFGAFVDVPTARGTATGLVHVSEVAPGFVENIYAEIGEGDTVTVKVLSIGEDGKIGLSIKQARTDWDELQELDKPVRSKIDKDFDRKLRKFMHGSQSIQGEARRQKRRKLGR